MALLSSLSYNQFINKGLFKKQNKTSNEIPRRKSSQRTGSTHAQMTNFLLPDSCTTTTEDFSLCAPCVFPRSLISGHICVRVHLSHLSVCLSTCALPCARRCWCGCWRMRRLVSSRRRRWLLSGTNTSSVWTRFKVEFCADTTHPPFITPAGASLRVGACVWRGKREH